MSFNLPVRVKHTSTTTGTGTLALIDPATNMQAFSAFAGAGPTKVLYALAGTSYWEIGVGTYTGGGTKTLTRDTIIASSSGGSAVSLPAATHDVFAWWPGGYPSVNITGTATLGLADLFQFLVYTGGAGTLNLPAVANVPAGIAIPFVNAGSGDWTHDGNGSETINSATTQVVKVGQGGWLYYQGPTSGQWRMVLGVTGSPAALDVAQTFTAAQTIQGAALLLASLICTDAGASGGPQLDLFRDSASPAVNDVIGFLSFSGRSSTGVKRSYAEDTIQILDAANGSEDAVRFLRTIVAGSVGNRLAIGNGIYTPSATGGDPGADKINAKDFLLDGTTLAIKKGFTSTNQTITSAATQTLAHGLGARPKFVTLELECTSAENGFSVGDVIEMKVGHDATPATDGYGVSVTKDATNLVVRYGSNVDAFRYPNKTTGVSSALTNSSWVARFSAFA